jgi:anti-sigma-K factor RskA
MQQREANKSAEAESIRLLSAAYEAARVDEARTWAQLIFWRSVSGISILINIVLFVALMMFIAEEW